MSPESVERLDHVSLVDAGAQLARLIERVENGEEIVIDRSGVPVARLVPLHRPLPRTSRGALKGKLVLADDWDSPEVNRSIAEEFGGA